MEIVQNFRIFFLAIFNENLFGKMSKICIICIGKYIEGSGIDTAWETCEMYGSVTVNQIFEGRHIYRGIQAHTVTLMALHNGLFLTKFS